MPVFYFLVICGAIAVWFLLSGLFYPIGKFLKHIGNDAIGELTREDKNKKEKKTEDNEWNEEN